ncbi:MAG: cytochrome c biogenesis protein CcsA [Pseudobdellovibrio sp.]
MKNILIILMSVLSLTSWSQETNSETNTENSNQQPAINMQINPEKVLTELTTIAENIEVSPLNLLPVQQNGRIKPFDTLAKESLVYITGSYKKFGLQPVQLFTSLMAFEGSQYIELIEIRSKELRVELGFQKSKRFYSVAELEGSDLMKIVDPLLKKQKESPRLLIETEKKAIEGFQQYVLAKEIITGQLLSSAVDYSFINQKHGTTVSTEQPSINQEVQNELRSYFRTITKTSDEQKTASQNLIAAVKKQKVPELFQHYLDKMEIEVFYNSARLFLWASILCLFLGLCFFTPLFKNKISYKLTQFIYIVPIVFIAFGLSLRVYITKFAPITNMFGTMIWVSFGIMLFSYLLFLLYKNYTLPGITLIVSGLMLMLTEQVPLILSPDLDPIVAVLRSNFWLSTHVTTITISYAAFSIAMVLGNIALIRLWIYKDNEAYFKEYSHYAYRMIQLGCFLLSVGIILGGIWADYSWGRFWGWDPKETWALIADLGFLAILHARIVGWMTPFYLLAWSPLAYLLVIMAWYGVNFILAAGLHSYGFSSGGATMVAVFVTIQVVLLLAGLVKMKQLKKSKVQTV